MSEEMLRSVQSSPALKLGVGSRHNVNRVGEQNDQMVSQLHGGMYEQALRGNLFFAANQAATAISVAGHTTNTGLCLSNPAGNSKNLVPRQVSIGISVQQVALACMGIGGGYAAAGIVTHTTPLTAYSCLLGSGTGASACADAAATLVGTPLVIMPFVSTGLITTESPKPSQLYDLNGSIIIPPGGYVFLYALTAITGLFGITWEEVPR